MDTKTVLVLAAVAVGGVVLYTKLKPGFSVPTTTTYGPLPSPTAPPSTPKSTLDQALDALNRGTEIVKAGESIFNTARGWF